MSVITNHTPKKHKLRSISVFGSDEWMAGATKKYRHVFDRSELDYVRCELSFYNKAQRNEKWKCMITFKCFTIDPSGRKEICSLDCEREIQGTEDIVYVRDGWGNPERGNFWRLGTYAWEVYLDEEFLGSAEFFVNDVGIVTGTKNPYFSVTGMKLFADTYNGWQSKNRNYLSVFDRSSTQYVWAEVEIENKTPLRWDYEIFFNFRDGAGQMKGQERRFGKVESNKTGYKFLFEVGWGNDVAGSWKSELYHLDVVFMDTLVASGSFYTSNEMRPGLPFNLFLLQN